MRNSKFLELSVGFFVIFAAIGLGFLAYKVSKHNTIGAQSSYTLYAKFNSVTGLKEGSAIMMAGVKIGTVEEISLLAKNEEFLAQVEMTVDKMYNNLPLDTSASILTSGLLGEKYLGLGPSAVSTIDQTRWKNVPDTAAYIRQISSVGHAQTEIENLTDEDFRIERIALMLRTTEGLPLSIFTEPERERVQTLVSEGLAALTDKQFILTKKGSLLVDAIVEHIL